MIWLGGLFCAYCRMDVLLLFCLLFDFRFTVVGCSVWIVVLVVRILVGFVSFYLGLGFMVNYNLFRFIASKLGACALAICCVVVLLWCAV